MNPFWLTPLLTGFLLDALLGDPKWLPHPIRWIGHLIAFCEKRLNNGKHRQTKGMLTTLFLVLATWSLLFAVQTVLSPHPKAAFFLESVFVFWGLAGHCLIKEALTVEHTLQQKGLNAAREQLRFIVGRETTHLDENQIRTAVLETLSENLSDGVVAPLFFYFLGGIPLMFAYKTINTLDSMIGYKNDRYRKFGWFAARLDDVFNYIPARLTALLIVLCTFHPKAFRVVFIYGKQHTSPNAGYPEAALAGVLKCRLGGPNRYHGCWVNKPYIGNSTRKILSKDLYAACFINAVCSIVLLAVLLIFSRV